jgi:hypothetical protein
MTDYTEMLEAHVQFELRRWGDDSLRATVVEEVDALFTWLGPMRLEQLANPEQVLAIVERVVNESPISPLVVTMIEDAIKSAFAVLVHDSTPMADLLDRRQYDQMTEILVGMKELRREITRQVVSSSVYSMLVSHVLYNGIKAFALTENIFARKIPGASSLVKFGQNALNSAGTNLESRIDNQLIAFIHANIRETLNESERYLNSVLDDKRIWQLADELWQSNAERTTAGLVSYVDASSLVDMVDFAQRSWQHLRSTDSFHNVLAAVINDFFVANGNKPIGELLAGIELTPAIVADELHSIALPLVHQARQSGYLESRIRSRLEPFYTDYAISHVNTGV